MAKQRTDTESVLKLIINGQQAKTSVTELRDTFYKLTAEMNNMHKADDPKAYAEKASKVKQLKDAWNEARAEINGTTKSVKGFNLEFAEIAKGVFGGQMLTRAWDMASRGIVDFISRNAELSDMMASVIKTTGLNEAAVDRLNEKFKKFDTRTAKEELMGLAYVAGKLGYTMEADVEAFVRSADRIGVALGDELGGTEEAVKSIGKLVDIFKVNDTFGLEESLSKVGSIINELGQAGTANEAYLIDFTQRMAGIAPVAGISMQAIMGMAATLDELGQPLEASSTAIGQFIVKMGADIPKFAKIAGISVKDFTKLLKEDANEAFLKVLEASDSAGGGIQKLAENMGLIDVAGARGIAALGVLSGNVDKLREKQALSNVAFDEGTSILKEFENVNYTLGANLQKLQNRMSALWENSKLRTWFTDITAAMVDNTTEAYNTTNAYLKQKEAFEENEKAINPLITRYEELKKKKRLDNDEHIEFQSLIAKIGELMPSVITQYNEYGTAVDINILKVRELTKSQKELFQLREKDTISSLRGTFTDQSSNAKAYQSHANKLQAEGNTAYKYFHKVLEKGVASMPIVKDWFPIKDVEQVGEAAKLAMGEAYDAAVKLRDEFGVELTPEMQKVIDHFEGIKKASGPTGTTGEEVDNRVKVNEELARLEAEHLETNKTASEKEKEIIRQKYQALRDLAVGNQDQINRINSQEQKELSAVKVEKEKTVKSPKLTEAEKLKAELIKINDDIFLNSLEGFDKETEAIRLKYEKLRVLAKDNKDQLSEIDRLEGEESRNLFNKTLAAGKKAEDELLKKKKETVQKIKELGLSGAALEIELENQKFADLISLAEQYGIDIAAITEARAAKILAIEAKYKEQALEKEKKETEKQKEKEREIRDFAIDSSKMAADTIFQIGENSRRARYDREFSELDNQRDKELSNKNLTEAQKEAINKKYDEKARELKRKEFKENQRAAIAEAFINMALGIGKAIPNPWKMAFAGASGLAQIAVIKSQSPKFKYGGLLPKGSSHAQGGIDLWDQRRQQIIGNIEGGEPILSKETYANNREVVDELLYSSQRRAGARIQLDPELIDAERMVRNGGYAMNHKQAAPVVQVSNEAPDFSPMMGKMDDVVTALKEIKYLEVYLSTRALEDHNTKMAKLKNDVNA